MNDRLKRIPYLLKLEFISLSFSCSSTVDEIIRPQSRVQFLLESCPAVREVGKQEDLTTPNPCLHFVSADLVLLSLLKSEELLTPYPTEVLL